MKEIIVHSEEPLIRSSRKYIPKEICHNLIEFGKNKLSPGKVVSMYTGQDIIDETFRSASVVSYDKKSLPHYDLINDLVSDFTGIDKERFEKLTLTHYDVNQSFSAHQDYFIEIPKNNKHRRITTKRCKTGGNRVGTVILYLNDVVKGGETYFPWLDIAINPEEGMICEFKYDYEQPLNNLKTQHTGMPVLEGEKWIITVWIREKSLTEEVKTYKRFKEESRIFEKIEDIEYNIDIGPDNDIRTMKLSLPANDSPMNGIIVGVTGGMESTILLYLLAVLNTYQQIPYQIVPVMISTKRVGNKFVLTENFKAVEMTVDYINRKIKYPVIRKIRINDVINNKPEGWMDTLEDILINGHKQFDYARFTNFKYIYIGDNELPTFNENLIARSIPLLRFKKDNPIWMQPFFNLQKYHILDMYIKLNLTYFFNAIGKCSLGHKSLDERCQYFACEERRFSFIELNRKDLGDKYFL